MDQSFSQDFAAGTKIADAPTVTLSLRGPSHGRRPADQLASYLSTSDGGVFLGEHAAIFRSWTGLMEFVLKTMRPYRDGGQSRMTFYADGWRGASFGFEKPSSDEPDSFLVAFFDPPANR